MGMSKGVRGAACASAALSSSQSDVAVAKGSGSESRRKPASFSFSVVWALSHCVNKAIWTDACRFASLSDRAASIRAADAWLKLIDIDLPHLLAWKVVHAVRMVVTEMRMAATSSRQSADDEGNATGRGELLLSVGSELLLDTNSLSPLRDLLL